MDHPKRKDKKILINRPLFIIRVILPDIYVLYCLSMYTNQHQPTYTTLGNIDIYTLVLVYMFT